MNPIFKEFDGTRIDPIIGCGIPTSETTQSAYSLTPPLKGSSRLLLTGLLAAGIGSMALAPKEANAASSSTGAICYTDGFLKLYQDAPDMVGICKGGPVGQPNGDVIQQTERGILVWDKLTNTPRFGDGGQTLIEGPYGEQLRDAQLRYAWELGIVGAPGDLFAAPVATPVILAPTPEAPKSPESKPNTSQPIDYSDWNSEDAEKLRNALNTTLGYNATFTINDFDSDFKNKLGSDRVARYAGLLSRMSPYSEAVKKIKKISVLEAQYKGDLGHAYGNGDIQIDKDTVEGRRYSPGFTDILIQEVLWKEIISDDLAKIVSSKEGEPLTLYLASLVTKNKIKAGAEFQRNSSADQLRTQAIQAIPA